MILSVALFMTIAVPAPFPADTACQKLVSPIGDTIPSAWRRQSPLDSITFKVSGKPVKICYGRPSLRGREMVVGDQNPYGDVWRTGANEPTIIYTSAPLTIAGVKVPAGVHSLFTVPGEEQWEIIINKVINQWGTEYDESEDVGRGTVKSEALQQPIEQFTIRSDAAENAQAILLEWQKFRVRVPVATS